MFSLLLKPLRLLVRAFADQDSPRQIAMGLALGAVIGLVPKGNLLAAVLMMIVCASRVNLGAAMLSAFAFSWIGMWVDPLSHRIGLALLSHDAVFLGLLVDGGRVAEEAATRRGDGGGEQGAEGGGGDRWAHGLTFPGAWLGRERPGNSAA